MRRQIRRTSPPGLYLVLALLLAAFATPFSRLHAQSNSLGSFSYQGRFNDPSGPATGLFDFNFALFATNTGGLPVVLVASRPTVSVTNGLFNVTLAFPETNAFDGSDRWLEISVQPAGSGGPATVLSPRQKITAAPYAMRAANAQSANTASALSGSITAAQLPPEAVLNGATGVTLNGTFAGNGSGLSNVNAATLGGFSSAAFWKTNGNAGANPTNGAFLGTADNLPLELRVNGARALRLEPTSSGQPNVVAGHSSNVTGPGVHGSAISGGTGNLIEGTNAYSMISGGAGNLIQGGAHTATIGGGSGNSIASNAYQSTIAGGWGNNIQPNASSSFIGGGWWNYVGTNAQFASVGGGFVNGMGTGAWYSVIPGGYYNLVDGSFSFAAGRRAWARHNGTFAWADNRDEYFTSTGSNQFLVRASGGVGINTNNPQVTLHVAGSYARVDGAGDEQAYLGGDGAGGDVQVGSFNTNVFSVALWNAKSFDYMNLFAKGGYFSGPVSMSTTNTNTAALTIQGALAVEGQIRGGYAGNMISNGVVGGFIGGGGAAGFPNGVGGNYSSVLGGLGNRAQGEFATVTGGKFNTAATMEATVSGGAFNSALGFSSTIGGGGGNAASGAWSTIAGGRDHVVTNADYASIGGGSQNRIETNAVGATVAGGGFNTIRTNASWATISGGLANTAGSGESTVSGGAFNSALGFSSTVGGGGNNRASGGWATIAGGRDHAITNADYATISGGGANIVLDGAYGAMIPGGFYNAVAAPLSFAAGRQAKANHIGSFVWADSTIADFPTVAANEFAVRASGGLRLHSDRGVSLNAADAPLITRGWDVFDASAGPAKSGLGRWGLFIEPFRLVAGIPGEDVGSRFFEVAKYSTNGSNTALMRVDQSGNVTAGSFSGMGGQPLDFKVNGLRGLRLEPAAFATFNVVGGSSSNRVENGAYGATIAGGGLGFLEIDEGNRVGGNFGTVGGGRQNNVTGAEGTVAGGRANLATAFNASVGGGYGNIASGPSATVPGGEGNIAGESYAFAAGRRANASHVGTFVWADSTDAYFTSAGSNQFLVRAGGGVGINTNNPAGASLAVRGNTKLDGNITAGYVGNIVSNGVLAGSVLGGGSSGFENRVGGHFSTVAGGVGNLANGYASLAGGEISRASGRGAIALGWGSVASGEASVAMGYNTLASAYGATAFGWLTRATNDDATAIGQGSIAGGWDSLAAGTYAVAAGHYSVAMGYYPQANHQGSFVWADSTSVSPFASTAANQFLIRASGGVGIGTPNPQAPLHLYSANNPTVMRIQSTGTPGFGRLEFLSNPQGDVNEWRPGYIQSTDNGGFTGGLSFVVNGTGAGNKFAEVETMRIVNGRVGIGTATPSSALQVIGTVTATAFNPPSDRNLKENFTRVNPGEVLEKVAALPISRWNFKGDAETPHVGPMAQDFHAAFGLGTDERHIATVDADGVALAAIQGLNQKLTQKLQQKETEIAELKARLEKLESLILRAANQ